MRPEPALRIRELGPREIEAILDRNNVGRIAFSFRDRVDIEPINYVHSEGWLYGRTSPGTKLATIQHNYWVAFEVDEVEGVYDWRSVVVHGGFYTIPPAGSEQTVEVWERAVALLRSLWPSMLTAEDPAAHRWVLFRIAIQEVRGFAATSEPDAGGAAG
ncbi:MAG TPA: pyridoxamine 5'-phosphate oxidase family protein [Longimicrobiales bacterium]